LKRRIYARDSGHCCMCNRVVDLTDSELDHRIALQFGGDNSERNLWTLCTECHAGKSAREVATGQPDEQALKHEVPEGNQASGFVGSDACQPRGVSSRVNIDRPGHRPPLIRRKNPPLEGVNMLTAQKRKYALALMSGMSQKDAAIKAGYSEKSARSRGRSLLKTRRSSRL
jgi:hypothetical protein